MLPTSLLVPCVRFLFLLVLLFIAGPVAAQTPGSCTLGTAQAALDVNNVSAMGCNTGSLFYGNASSAAYLVPQQTGRSPIYTAGLWIGGRVNGELRVAGGTYGAPQTPGQSMDFTFWPGPMNETGGPINPADCSPYDRIFRVSRADIAAYDGGQPPAADLADWPGDLGAPVLDGDGVLNNYDLAAGDRPDLVGDQALWWIMNDVGNIHPAQNTPPLGVEVRVLAFAFDRPDALGDATFYRYSVRNKSGLDIADTYVSVFVDPDLGDAGDDYVGSDPATGLAFAYNADNADGNGTPPSYGTPPPAVGFDFFQGPIVADGPDAGTDADTLSASAISYFRNGDIGLGDPNDGQELYNLQQGLWGDGSQMRAFGDGFQETQGAVTRFAFPGDPVTNQAWSERNTGAGATVAGDRRFAIHTGPFTLERDASQDIVFGIVFAQGTSNLSSITALRAADALAQATFDNGFIVASDETPAAAETRLAASPNPFTTEARVSVGETSGPVRAVLYDVLGREVAVVHDGPLAGAIRVSGTRLVPGVYLLRVRSAAGEQTVRLVRR